MSTSTHLITADELMRMSDDGHRYELVKGELLTMSPTGYEHGELLGNLFAPLKTFVKHHKLGRAAVGDPGFKLESDPDTVLAPDISFISAGRLRPRPRDFARTVPDLVVEVVSPSDRKSQVARKVRQWLAFGVRSVWLVRPNNRTVEVVSQNGLTRILNESETLADDVVPGFEILVSLIFEDSDESL